MPTLYWWFRFSLALLFLLFSFSAFSQNFPEQEEWWTLEGAPNRLTRSLDHLGDGISEEIFNSINDFKLFDTQLGDAEVEFDVHRRVFNNHTVNRTFTVMDRFEMRGSLPLYSLVTNAIDSVSSQYGFTLGLNGSLEFINIRQVELEDLPKLKTPEEHKIEIETAPWYEEFQTTSLSESEESQAQQWVYRVGNEGSQELTLLPLDPENQVRYSKLWNLVVFPFRLPVTPSALNRLQKNEIISYVGQGSIQFGASAGWGLDPSNITGAARADVTYSVFVNGIYRVSILKEDEQGRFARIKVTRGYGLGHGFSAGSSSKPDPFEGVMFLKHISNALKIIPFRFSLNENYAHDFDISYRYDLSKPEAQKAYQQAVFGLLAASDELAVDLKGRPKNFNETGVEKLPMRETDSIGASRTHRMRLGIFFSRDAKNQIINTETTVTISGPNGYEKRHLFTALVENSWKWKFFWSFYEKFKYLFGITLDLDEYSINPNSDSALNLLVDGQIRDSDTSRDELIDYMVEIENSVGKFNLFPRPPELSGSLGSSRFMHRLSLNQRQIQKFINIPEHKMWNYLEKSFGVSEGYWSNSLWQAFYQLLSLPVSIINLPLYVANLNIREGSDLMHARRIKYKWEALKYIKNIKERAEGLGALFFDSLFSYELVRLLRYALHGEKVDYFAAGVSDSFPGKNISSQGGTTLIRNNLATEMQQKLDFDRPGSRYPTEIEASVQNLSVQTRDEKTMVIRFNLASKPRAMVFQLYEMNVWLPFWWFNEKKIDLFLDNINLFDVGANTAVLNIGRSASEKDPWSPMAEQIQPGSRYLLRVSANVSGKDWGPTSEQQFRANGSFF